jgi:molecular chaperone GrpE
MHGESKWGEEDDLFGLDWLDEAFSPRRARDGSPEMKSTDIVKTNTKAEEYRDLLQRLQADFNNYKRRVEREREERTKLANRELILKLLPVLDDFTRALESVLQEKADAGWVEGMALIARKLTAILEDEGLTRIDAAGKEFNPWEHEAVRCEESSDHDEGRVKAILRDGYKLHDIVIRPAQVVVTCRGKSGESLTS